MRTNSAMLADPDEMVSVDRRKDSVALARFLTWACEEARDNLKDEYLLILLQNALHYIKIKYDISDAEIGNGVRSCA